MLKEKVLGSAIAVAGAGSTVENNESPFIHRHEVLCAIKTSGLSGQAKIQHSDDGSSWTDILDTGSVTTNTEYYRVGVTLKKYVRYNMVSRTAGSATFTMESAV